ncbi:MAG: hypothetical protein KAS17_04750 [Victivallaceae bacterium]|nr:hypothetical protein [Victivallaceae bacterium]
MIKNIDNIYYEIIDNLRLKIESDFGSVSKFCQEKNICRFNLSKVFHKHQVLSVTHYIKICVALGMLCPEHNIDVETNLSLRDYLRIDHHSITMSLLSMIAI